MNTDTTIYYLYKITNTINNKLYIGQAKNIKHRWGSHRSEAASDSPTMIIHRAMKKHKIENFLFEVIAMCIGLNNSNFLETELIKQYESHISTKKGYNVLWGGNNAPKPEIFKQKMSKIFKGKHLSVETEFKRGADHNGAKLTEEQVLEIARLNKTNKYTHQEIADKFGVSRLAINAITNGYHWSHITKIGISEPRHKNTELRKGSRHPMAILNDDQVLEIVAMYQTHKYSCNDLAKHFNVKKGVVKQIISGKSWSHITLIGKNGTPKFKRTILPPLGREEVLEVIKLYNTNKFSPKEISAKYNVSTLEITNIITRKKYTNITAGVEIIRRSKSELSKQLVLEIIKQYNEGNYNHPQLADKFGVSKDVIQAVLSGKSWSHITGIIYQPKSKKSLK
jgi:group I intron endonuclease